MRTPTIAPAGRARLVRAAAAAALLIGYVDLVRGGTTIAPTLLAMGYLIFVPAAIVTWR